MVGRRPSICPLRGRYTDTVRLHNSYAVNPLWGCSERLSVRFAITIDHFSSYLTKFSGFQALESEEFQQAVLVHFQD